MDVVFRKYKSGISKGEIIALFPHDVCDNQGHVTSYEHIGQHSGANYTHCIRISTKATESEYKDLKNELEQIGYKNLKVVSKQNYNKWLESYRNLN